MVFKIITVAFDKNKESFFEEELNKYLLNKTLKSYDVKFFSNEKNAYWTVFLAYEHALEKDFKNNPEFSESENLLREKLREWRKEKADSDGVPVYIIFANEQLNNIGWHSIRFPGYNY